MISFRPHKGSAHIWAPDLQATGGIQHYSRALIQALAEINPTLKIRVLSKNDRNQGAVTGGFDLPASSSMIASYGRWPSRLRTLAFAMGGLWHAWKERPDWILATHPHFAKALRLVKRLTGTPYGVVCHGIETWGKVRGSMKQGLEEAALVIAVSDYTRHHLLEEASLSPDRVCVVPNTFDESLFQLGAKPSLLLDRYGLSPEQPVLVTVGRLASTERYKGHEDVLRALPAIRERQPGIRYIIVGDGDDLGRLRGIASECGILDSVVFAGHVPREELPFHYLLADIFVMPSTGEGFGIVFLESLASGRPVIAARSTASPEAIDHGRLGELVTPGIPDEIVTSVFNVLDRSLRPQLHNPAWLRSEVVRLFGFEAFKDSLRGALAKL